MRHQGLLLGAFLLCWQPHFLSAQNNDCINEEGTGPTAHTEHSNNQSIFTLTREQRQAKRCEHAMAAIDCAQCSSTVGVVHVAKELLQPASGSDGLITVGTVSRITVDDKVETFGHIALDEERAAHVSPRVSGAIKEVHTELGAEVSVGAPLFDICSVEVGTSAASYLKARALCRLAHRELTRARQLLKQRVTSEKEVFRLENEYEQAIIERDATKRQLLILGVTEKELTEIDSSPRLLQGRLTVRSPLEGRVIEKHAVAGEVIEPGTSVMLIADLALVWVWAQVYDRDAGIVLQYATNAAKEARITIDAFPKRSFPGVIDYVSPIVSKDTRTVKLRIIVDNAERLLLPGMFCRVSLPLHSHTITAVPRHAVMDDGERQFVFRPYDDRRFVVCPVTVGVPHGDYVPIVDGLTPGQPIVTHGTFMLKSEILKERMGAG